jgi:hypothetical protein
MPRGYKLTENLAPIAVFAFNRPTHLEKTLSALSENIGAKDSNLYLFVDGPRNSEDLNLINACIKIGNGFSKNFKTLKLEQNQLNKGLANSIISGITLVLQSYPKVIVVEDDLVTSPYFLDFINRGLEQYQNQKAVASIHGFVLPFTNPISKPFFMKGADCWGWGTWTDRWELFNPDGQSLLDELRSKNLVYEFDLDGSYSFSEMLENQIAGKNNSWAIRWHASMFLRNKLTLYPAQTYVENIGFDGSGTHTGETNIFYSPISKALQELPKEVSVSEEGFRETSKWYRDVYFGKQAKINKKIKVPYLVLRNFLKRIFRKTFR